MLLTKKSVFFRFNGLNQEQAMKIRQSVIDSLAEYFAELSFIAFHEFAEDTTERIQALPLNRKWHRLFKQYRHKIMSKGVYEVGNEIMLDLEQQLPH